MKFHIFEKHKQEIYWLEAVLNWKFQCDLILPFKLSSSVTLAYAKYHVLISQEQWWGIPWQFSGWASALFTAKGLGSIPDQGTRSHSHEAWTKKIINPIPFIFMPVIKHWHKYKTFLFFITQNIIKWQIKRYK